MTKKKVTRKKKSNAVKGKSVLFLHVDKRTKTWLHELRARAELKSKVHMSVSSVADRLLKNLKRHPQLLKEALK